MGARRTALSACLLATTTALLAPAAGAASPNPVSKGSARLDVPGTGELYFSLTGQIRISGKTFNGSAWGVTPFWDPSAPFSLNGVGPTGGLAAQCTQSTKLLPGTAGVATLTCKGSAAGGPWGKVVLRLVLPKATTYPEHTLYTGTFAGS